MPKYAEIAEVEAMLLSRALRVIQNTANAALPCARLDMTIIGQMKVPPWLEINCRSTARNMWCMPVITSGAYNRPKIRPPTSGARSISITSPSVM